MSKFVRSILSSVFNLTALSLNFNLTAASQQIKVNFSQHKSNACEQAFIFLFIPYVILTLTCVRFLSLCVNTAWTHTTHAQYSYTPSCNCTFSCIYQLSQCSLRKSFLCLKCMAPFRNHVLVNYSDWFSFTVQAKWHTLAAHLTVLL